MIFYCFRVFPAFLIFVVTCQTQAQQTEFYWQPETSFNYSPPNRWSFNWELNNRSQLDADPKGFQAKHLEVSHFTTYESGFYGKISLGVRYRNRDWFEARSNEFRLTEQYNYAKYYNQFRLGHRARFEQRFFDDETVFRLRYRLALDFPLQGITLNTGEFYTALSLETLYSLGKQQKLEFSQRLNWTIGNQIQDNLKIQVSVEYRKEDYLNPTANRAFIYTSSVFNF
ncbi:MAG: DUF2490 domain-containing protein [Leeuwenhoekiella sp.]